MRGRRCRWLDRIRRTCGSASWPRSRRAPRPRRRPAGSRSGARPPTAGRGRRAEAGVGGSAPERLVSLDECGVLTSMARLYGRSPRGERAKGTVPHGHWTKLSVLGALGHEGMLAAMSVQAATDGAVFRAYLERVLLPELRRA